MEGWWYEGAGIYRPVWLIVKEKTNISNWGVAITTPEVSKRERIVKLEHCLENHSPDLNTAQLLVSISDPNGKEVCNSKSLIRVPPGEKIST